MLPTMSSSLSGQPAYEVFLSFRGLDTRHSFAHFLYTLLIDVGIIVFLDEKELESGIEINAQLIKAIEQCKISIPVISEDYASSNSCLMELERMVECMDRKNHIIIPIFYHVDPKKVRHCEGAFEKANDNQQRALSRIGNLTGHHLVERSDKNPTEVMKQVVRKVEHVLKTRDLHLPKQLVDVDPLVQDIMAKLKFDHLNGQLVKNGDTCKKVLIYGIPGVGKTVLAKCVYNRINHLYDACGFLENIQEEIERKDNKGVLSLQNRLITLLHKKHSQKCDSSNEALRHIRSRFYNMELLLLFDNVRDYGQLNALVGKLDWLHLGSTVIVTSPRDDVLQKVEGAEKFGLRTMQKEKALQLFCQYAFEKDSPPKHFEKLSKEIVAATDGLPLALMSVGALLSGTEDCDVWRETPTAWEQAPNKRVQEALVKSYNTLNNQEQDIFLDIACFFSGKDKKIPYYMWKAFEFSPSTSFLSLHAMSFLETGEDEDLRMHGILKTFGREIVKNENRNEPYQRSRLWNHKEALKVLRRKKGTGTVIALGLEFPDGSTEDNIFKSDEFVGLHNLRFLKLHQADVRGNFGDCLSSLRWLDWQGCPRIFDVQSLNLNLQELLILDLSGSQVDKDWRGWELLEQARELKVLKLTGCVQLTDTPEFHPSMELEILILEGCSRLAFIRPSLGNLTKLVSLNVKGCSSLLQLPDSIRYLKSLEYLALDGSTIHTLPKSIRWLKKLQILSLKSCQKLTDLPNGIGNLSSLQSLDLSHTAIPELPLSIKDLKAMKVLRMKDTLIQEFPKAILNLEKLEEIDFSLCPILGGEIPDDISRLSSLAILKLTCTKISGLPPNFHRLSHLRELDITGCSNLRSQPQ